MAFASIIGGRKGMNNGLKPSKIDMINLYPKMQSSKVVKSEAYDLGYYWSLYVVLFREALLLSLGGFNLFS